MGLQCLRSAPRHNAAFRKSLVYDRFPENGTVSQVSIVNTDQVCHITPSNRHAIELEMFAASVDIPSNDGLRRTVAVVRIPVRFWLSVFTGRAKPELLVIRRRLSFEGRCSSDYK
jgi:hypothetical protein